MTTPKDDQSLRGGDRQEEPNAEGGRQQDRREDQVHPERVLRQLHPDPQALVGADVLAEDRPEDGVGRGDPQSREQRRQAGWPAELPEDLAPGRPERAKQVRRVHRGGGEAVEQSDRDRKERDEDDDEDLRRQPEAEPDDEERRDRHDGHGLRRDEERLEGAAERREA